MMAESSEQEEKGTNRQEERGTDAEKSSGASEQATARPKDEAESAPQNQHGRAQLGKTPKPPAGWPHPIKWFEGLPPIDKFTLSVAFFTDLLAVATTIQVWAFIQSERAFLSLSAINLTESPTVGKSVSVKVIIGNSGKSSANIVSNRISIATNLPPVPDYGPISELAFPPVVAGGNSTSVYGGLAPLTDIEVKKIAAGTMPFYVYGAIEYEDEFSFFSTRITAFCAVYDPAADQSRLGFNTCPQKAYTYAH